MFGTEVVFLLLFLFLSIARCQRRSNVNVLPPVFENDIGGYKISVLSRRVSRDQRMTLDVLCSMYMFDAPRIRNLGSSRKRYCLRFTWSCSPFYACSSLDFITNIRDTNDTSRRVCLSTLTRLWSFSFFSLHLALVYKCTYLCASRASSPCYSGMYVAGGTAKLHRRRSLSELPSRGQSHCRSDSSTSRMHCLSLYAIVETNRQSVLS